MNGQSCGKWRLLYDEPMDGARNMARDGALLAAVGGGMALPTLRLYAWQPATLSLGYGQRFSDVDGERLHDRGWGVVRRLTGGRAILHADELTYSITLPETHSLAQGSVIDSYRRISAALAETARLLGASPEARPSEERGTGSAVCFETPSHYELTVNGRKLAGSAQARRHGGLLQHGSLPLYGDMGRIADVLTFEGETARASARAGVQARAVTLSEAAGRVIGWDEAALALVDAAERIFEIGLERGSLSDAERVEANALDRDVYGSAAWTQRR